MYNKDFRKLFKTVCTAIEVYNNKNNIKLDYLVNFHSDEKYSIIEINRQKDFKINNEDGWYLQLCPNGMDDRNYPIGVQYVIKDGEFFDYHILTDEELYNCTICFSSLVTKI